LSSTAGVLSEHLKRAGLRDPRIKVWFAYVAAFYVVWLYLVGVAGHWQDALSHWRIAVVMILGSVVAGSTPMGGGTVAFPVLVLLFHQSANIGRNFGMAIQALGMTSAMIFILCRRTVIQRWMLAWSIAGASIGLVIGTFAVAPGLPPSYVKLLFSTVWFSFGALTLLRNREFCSLERKDPVTGPGPGVAAFTVGILGGLVNSITGVGIEMLLYTVLVLLYRCDLKVAVPTAVSLGAMTSVMGIGIHALLGDIGHEAYFNWLAAGPIVVFGAPLGAYLVSIIPRIRTLYFVAILCVLQFAWTLYQVAPQAGEWIFVAASLVVATVGFGWLYRAGATSHLVPRAEG
jgi:uncharacterized protein